MTDFNYNDFYPKSIISEDWNDADYNIGKNSWTSRFPLWTNSSGDITGIWKTGFAGVGPQISADVNDFNSMDFNFRVRFQLQTSTEADYWFTNKTLTDDAGTAVSGYNIAFNTSTDTIKLISYSNGVPTTLISQSYQLAGGQYYILDMNRTLDGNFNLFLDGNKILIGAINKTYTDFNYFTIHNNSNTNNAELDISFVELTSYHDAYNSVQRSYSTLGNKLVCLTIVDSNLLSNTGCNTISITGDVNIQIRDENTLAPLIGATTTINGTNITQNGDGTLAFDMNILNGINTITTGFSGKTTRTWKIYADQNSNFDLNLMLLDTNKGSNIEFLIRDVNGTIYPDSNITVSVRKPSSPNADYNVFTGTTDSSGYVTIFLNPLPNNDGNYQFYINTIGKAITYFSSKLTVSIPLDEKDQSIQLTPYSITLSGLGSGSFTSLGGSKVINILTNTTSSYVFRIDANSDYFGRNYAINTIGAKDFNLTPLLPRTNQATTIAFNIKYSNATSIPIPNVQTQLFKTINGTDTLIESQETDASGTIRFNMLTTDTYFLNFYYRGNQICNFQTTDPCQVTINTTYTQYNILMDVNEQVSGITQFSANVFFNPSDSIISKTNSTQDFNQHIIGTLIDAITVTLTDSNGSILYTQSRSYTGVSVNDTFTQTINTNAVPQGHRLTISVDIQSRNLDQNDSFSNTYVLNAPNFIINLRTLPTTFGTIQMLLFSIFLTIILTGFLGFGIRDSGISVLIPGLFLGLFTFVLLYIPSTAFGISAFCAFVAYMWTERNI